MADDASTTEIRTFLIADVRGYTRFTQERGDEAGARLAARFAEVVGEVVVARAGQVVELRGDEALCVFASPRGALRAAVDLQRRCADELRADPSLPLRVGIGIDAGEAVAVAGGYRGGALNLAARLCSIAGPGEVLVSEGIVHLARNVDEMSYVDRGRVDMKGLDEPVHVMQVDFELDMPAPADADGPRWSQLQLVSATACVIAVVAAAATVAATRIAGNDHPITLGANVVGILDSSGDITGQVLLGGRPGGVATGAGSVWATETEHDSVVQINSAGRKVDTVPVGVAPTGVAVGGGGVWVADSGSGTVSWINAASPGQSDAIQVGQGPGPIAYGDGAAWVVNATDGTLQRLDPGSLKPSRPIAIGGAPSAVAVGGGSVWVTDTSSSSIVKVNPDTFQTIRLAVGNNPVAVAFGADRVWVANAADGTVTSLDPATGQRTQIAVGRNPSDVAYANGAVWVAVGRPPSVARIDTKLLHVDSTPTGSVPQAVSVSGDRAWVTALAAPTSRRGGTLRMVFSSDHFTRSSYSNPFDPAVPAFPDQVQLLAFTNDGLVAYRHAGGAAGVQVVPDLAVAMPTISGDGRTYTFQLRPDIRYSNGRPVRASDFRYSVERQFLPGVLKRGYEGYLQQEVFSDLVGYDACAQPPHTCHLVQGIESDDQTGTIAIHLDHSDPAFLQKLATNFGDLVPPGSPSPGSGRPVRGTGPYMVARTYRDGKDGFLMVRNPYFKEWSADAQPAGYPDQLRWSYVQNTSRELTAVETGTADVMIDQPPPDRLGELRTQYAALAHPYATLTTTYLALNTRVPPFDHTAVRRAVNLAVDRDHVATLFGGPQTQATTCQVLPPSMQGYAAYCPYTANPSPSGAWSAPDVLRAQALARNSGTQGTPVTLWGCVGETAVGPETRYLSRVLRLIGYPASVHIETECSRLYGEAGDSRRKLQAIVGGWMADYPSPIAFFDVLLTCRTFIPASGANFNWSEFCDHRLDGLVQDAEAAQAIDPTRAVNLWQMADREAVNQAPWVPLVNGLGLDVLSRRVGNYQHNAQWGALLDQLWVK